FRARAHRLQSLRDERDLHDDVRAQRGELASFAHDLAVLRGGDLRGHRSLHDVADLDEHVAKLAAALRDQRRVRGDAVDEPHRRGLADLLHVGGIDEELHAKDVSLLWRTSTSVPSTYLRRSIES